MIKPDEIPGSLVETIVRESQPFGSLENVAAILNAAIEAGVVAPASEAKVLRRAIEIAIGDEYIGSPEWSANRCIDQARRELESEEINDQAK